MTGKYVAGNKYQGAEDAPDIGAFRSIVAGFVPHQIN
jgi:hypothetical protein